MTEIGLGHYLTLGAVIFSIGIIGIFLNGKNSLAIIDKYVPLVAKDIIILTFSYLSNLIRRLKR